MSAPPTGLLARLWLPLAVVAAGLVVAQAAALILAGRADPLPSDAPSWRRLEFENQECRAASLVARAQGANDPWRFHPSGGDRKLSCVSEPLTLGPERFLILQYAGDTRDPAIETALVAADASERSWPLRLE